MIYQFSPRLHFEHLRSVRRTSQSSNSAVNMTWASLDFAGSHRALPQGGRRYCTTRVTVFVAEIAPDVADTVTVKTGDRRDVLHEIQLRALVLLQLTI
jgi:hypothetical protein